MDLVILSEKFVYIFLVPKEGVANPCAFVTSSVLAVGEENVVTIQYGSNKKPNRTQKRYTGQIAKIMTTEYSTTEGE